MRSLHPRVKVLPEYDNQVVVKIFVDHSSCSARTSNSCWWNKRRYLKVRKRKTRAGTNLLFLFIWDQGLYVGDKYANCTADKIKKETAAAPKKGISNPSHMRTSLRQIACSAPQFFHSKTGMEMTAEDIAANTDSDDEVGLLVLNLAKSTKNAISSPIFWANFAHPDGSWSLGRQRTTKTWRFCWYNWLRKGVYEDVEYIYSQKSDLCWLLRSWRLSPVCWREQSGSQESKSEIRFHSASGKGNFLKKCIVDLYAYNLNRHGYTYSSRSCVYTDFIIRCPPFRWKSCVWLSSEDRRLCRG